MRLYEVRLAESLSNSRQSIHVGFWYSLEKAKVRFEAVDNLRWFEENDGTWYAVGDMIRVIIVVATIQDEPDFATLAGEAFYATSE